MRNVVLASEKSRTASAIFRRKAVGWLCAFGASSGYLYHTTEWGIEGFIESIVKPGAARTQFRFGRAKLGPKVDVYNDTPAGMARRIFQDTSRLPQGEPAEMAKIDNDR